MKYFLLSIFLSACTSHCHSQDKARPILNRMENLSDQYNKKFSSTRITDRLVIIYVPGGDDPLQKIYDKLKGKILNSAMPVQFVGGFGELAADHGGGGMSTSHLINGFRSRYSSDYFSILLDVNSDIGKALGVKGLTVAEVSKKNGNIIKLNDYGYDRKRFFEDINQYLKTVK
jgi:hypothetical protein